LSNCEIQGFIHEYRIRASPEPLGRAGLRQDFDWSLVRSFLAALDRGSLLGAARALNTSQPTVGRHIAELESQLGVVLFERTGRGLLPSDAALRLADSARAMEASALRLARSASAGGSQIAGSVRISASQPVACVLLPPLLAQMRLALPEVQVDLVANNSVSNLLRREADIAVRMVQPDQATLIARRIGKVSLGTYAHRDYLRRHGTPKLPTDLLSHALIGHDQARDILDGFATMGYPVEREHFAIRSDDLIVYQEAVRAGLGIGFLADYVARAHPDLISILPMLKLPTLPVWLVVHREIRTSQRIRQVYDFLAAAIPAAL
jgi:DNA-binding transcriptional LysR family regulator